MSDNKEDSVMGLPKGCGKRPWTDDGDEDNCSSKPPKIVCTSPPYALSAEDVLKNHPTLTHAHTHSEAAATHAFECEITPLAEMERSPAPPTGEEDEEGSMFIVPEQQQTKISPSRDDNSDCDIDRLSDRTTDIDEEEEEEDNFIDDEEDKDSGFIDGNSIDNSSDDDIDMKEGSHNSSSPPASASSFQCSKDGLPGGDPSSDLQISLSKVLPVSSSSHTVSLVSAVTTFTTSVAVTSSCNSTESSLCPLPCASTIISKAGGGDYKLRDNCVTTVTAAQTGTVVTSAYSGAVPSPTYDLHSYHGSYSAELYLSRPVAHSWSCTFPEGSHPTPNKYMEISPTRTQTNQSIQCDENGKSYLELGSTSYTNHYSSECGNFTTSPSTYNASLYTQSFSGTSGGSYGQNNTYFNSRHNYTLNSYGYHHDSSGGGQYDGENGCYYGYPNNNTYQGSAATRSAMTRIPQRCSSPFCDPTRPPPRPSCYPQQRLSVLNMSMYKLNRYSRFPEPSLHRSVLIWNTLRHIEKELETEGVSMASILAQSHHYGPHNSLHGMGASAETMPSAHTANQHHEGPAPPPINSPLVGSSPHQSTAVVPPSIESTSSAHSPNYTGGSQSLPYTVSPYPNLSDPGSSYETKDGVGGGSHSLRPYLHQHPSSPLLEHDRASSSSNIIEPLVSEADSDAIFTSAQGPQPPRASSVPAEERTEDINWCSVLSLSSQTDLDAMSSSESQDWAANEGGSSSLQYPPREETPAWKLPSLSADDVLKSFPEAARRPEHSEDLDSIIKVLVGS